MWFVFNVLNFIKVYIYSSILFTYLVILNVSLYCFLRLAARHCGGDRWNALWRFCTFMRCGHDGADSKWISKQPRKTGAKNWYQHNLHLISRAALEEKPTVRQGTRSSRYDRWVSQGKEQRAKISASLSQPNCLQPLGICLNTFSRGMTRIEL